MVADVDLSLHRGQVHALIGENGAGISESDIDKITQRTVALANLWVEEDYNSDNISAIYRMCGPFKGE